MADTLSCSTRTVQRRLQALGLGRRQRYSDIITDTALDEQLEGIHSRHANTGYRMIEEILRSEGLFVQQELGILFDVVANSKTLKAVHEFAQFSLHLDQV